MASLDGGIGRSNSRDYDRDLSRSSNRSYLSSITSEDDEYEILPLPESELDQDFLDTAKLDESQEVLSKKPFKRIHDQPLPFDHPRRTCFLPGQKIHVEILGTDDCEYSSLFNPNLYLILIRHADFQWKIRRRYKHFRHLHEHLMLYRAKVKMPMPSREHQERRKAFRARRNTLPRFPKKPEPLVKEESMDKRQKQLEEYLQNILKCSQYRNHPEVLKFLEVSHLSFVFGLGAKYREGMVRKKAGGRRIRMSCFMCCGGSCVAPTAAWNERWLIVKDTFVAYLHPQTGTVNDLLLMDREFDIECGLLSTGVRHGLVVSNLSRHLTLKCWTQRKAREWHSEIDRVMHTTGQDFIETQRFDAFAPLRENSFVNWFVDGASYMDAVAEALEGAKEEIFITDWWLTPEIYMKRPTTEGEKWRLDFILKRKACQGVKIFIMVYKEMEVALGINSWYSKTRLQLLHPTNVKVLRHPDGINLWSHHEKCVIIDQRIAFLGGIDLCYGRWDTRAHRLTDLGDLAIIENKNTASGNIQNFNITSGMDLSSSQTSEGVRSRRARFSTIQERTEEEDVTSSNHIEEGDQGVFTYPEVHHTLDTVEEASHINVHNTLTSSSSDPIPLEDCASLSGPLGGVHITSIQLDSLPSTPERRPRASRVDSLPSTPNRGPRASRVDSLPSTPRRVDSSRERETEESNLDTDEDSLYRGSGDNMSNMCVLPQRVSIQSDIHGSYLNPANSDTDSANVSPAKSAPQTTATTTWASSIPSKRSLTRSFSIEEEHQEGGAETNTNNNANDTDPPQNSKDSKNNMELSDSASSTQGSHNDSMTTTSLTGDRNVGKKTAKSSTAESLSCDESKRPDHVLSASLPLRNGTDLSHTSACDSSTSNASARTVHGNQESSKEANSGSDSARSESGPIRGVCTDPPSEAGPIRGVCTEPPSEAGPIRGVCTDPHSESGPIRRVGPSHSGSVQRTDSDERHSLPGSMLTENSPTKTVLHINRHRPKSLADVARLLIDRNKEPDEPAPFKNYLRTIAIQVMEQQREARANGSNGSLNTTPDGEQPPRTQDRQDGRREGTTSAGTKAEGKKKRPPNLHLNMPHMTRQRRGSKASDVSEEGLEVDPGGEISGPLADAVRAAASGLPTKPTTPKSKRRNHMAQKARDFKTDMKEKFRKNKSISVDITEDARTWGNGSMDVYIQKGEQKVIDPMEKLAELGLEGSMKTWIGKDYVNFIIKDLSDVDHPFTDNVDRKETPRMPWHDIGAVVYGKSARDVARHFIQRWNFTKLQKHKKNADYPLLLPKDYSQISVPMWVIQSAFCAKCQVLRSAARWSAGITETEMSIQTAYLHLIDTAKHFIYIENQFFISIAGHASLKNKIADALYNRIIRAYQDGETFRVYVIMPLLPAFEGQLGTASGLSIQAVIHWNYLSLSRGGRSLLERLVKEGKVPDPFEYISFYGLRKHEECLGNLMTELVYVHCKLMIVDDTKVIIGSANINDRSMVGSRDSELAILVEDTQTTTSIMDGKPYQAGHFALSLRKTLMKEHLGLTEDDLLMDVSDPIDAAFYKMTWLNQASINTSTYDKVFNCIPTDDVAKFSELRELQKRPVMAKTDSGKAKELLKKVRGQLVLMPLQFLVKERLAPAVHTKEGLAGVASIWT